MDRSTESGRRAFIELRDRRSRKRGASLAPPVLAVGPRRGGWPRCYLKRRRAYLRYGEALAEGLPIATGVIMGACRHLVHDRLDCCGARWSVAGAEAVLQLRALRASGDFDAYWAFHLEQEHTRNHASRYADGVTPNAIPKPRLRLVK
jgi:hypothetical protein